MEIISIVTQENTFQTVVVYNGIMPLKADGIYYS